MSTVVDRIVAILVGPGAMCRMPRDEAEDVARDIIDGLGISPDGGKPVDVPRLREMLPLAQQGLTIPDHKRGDAEYLRVSVECARFFVDAAVLALGEKPSWASRSDTWFAWRPVRVGALKSGPVRWLRRLWRNRCMGVTIYQDLPL